MEKIQDFFKHVGERLRNPFLFSYLITWLIANYKIIVGLFFYTSYGLKDDGYKSYFDLIDKTKNWWTCLWIPLIGAVLYTFIIPLLRIAIQLFYTWINQWQEKKTLKILGNGSISTKKYIILRENYKESEKRLQNIVDDDIKFMSERTKLHTQVQELTNSLNKTNAQLIGVQEKASQLDIIKRNTDVSFLHGTWNGAFIAENFSVNNEIEFDINLQKEELRLKLTGIIFPNPFAITKLMRSDRTIFLELMALQPARLPEQISQYIVFEMLHEHHLKGIGFNRVTFDLQKIPKE
ncbi:MAG: hypothetical protein IT249_09920 [Chitinophagaceae bacterium]|nr:hypothetical protein [Chitinophagaceae bacterium]